MIDLEKWVKFEVTKLQKSFAMHANHLEQNREELRNALSAIESLNKKMAEIQNDPRIKLKEKVDMKWICKKCKAINAHLSSICHNCGEEP